MAPGKDADLLGDDLSSTPAPNGTPAVPATQDLLAEIFGSSAPSQPGSTGSPAPAAPQRNVAQDILGLFDSPAAPSPAASPPPAAAPAPSLQSIFGAAAAVPQAASPPPAAAAAAVPPGYTAYDKNELRITLNPQTSATRPGLVRVIAQFQATGANPVTELSFQAAVPKSQQLQMAPISSPTIRPGSVETQELRVLSPVGVSLPFLPSRRRHTCLWLTAPLYRLLCD